MNDPSTTKIESAGAAPRSRFRAAWLLLSHVAAALAGAGLHAAFLSRPGSGEWPIVAAAVVVWPLVGYVGVRAALAHRRTWPWLVALIGAATAANVVFWCSGFLARPTMDFDLFCTFWLAHVLFALTVFLPGAGVRRFRPRSADSPRLTIGAFLSTTAALAALAALIRQAPNPTEVFRLYAVLFLPAAVFTWIAHWAATRREGRPRAFATGVLAAVAILTAGGSFAFLEGDASVPTVLFAGHAAVSWGLMRWRQRRHETPAPATESLSPTQFRTKAEATP